VAEIGGSAYNAGAAGFKSLSDTASRIARSTSAMIGGDAGKAHHHSDAKGDYGGSHAHGGYSDGAGGSGIHSHGDGGSHHNGGHGGSGPGKISSGTPIEHHYYYGGR